MTSHELAHKLLELPDVIVYIPKSEGKVFNVETIEELMLLESSVNIEDVDGGPTFETITLKGRTALDRQERQRNGDWS